jgi:hypothetical protein
VSRAMLNARMAMGVGLVVRHTSAEGLVYAGLLLDLVCY